jgi:hypothetical protein
VPNYSTKQLCIDQVNTKERKLDLLHDKVNSVIVSSPDLTTWIPPANHMMMIILVCYLFYFKYRAWLPGPLN